MIAPDLIEPVVGFRVWRVIDGRLLSPYIPCRWAGRVMHATCYPANRSLEFGRGWLDTPHESPHRDCKCGIYAYHRPGTHGYVGEWEWVDGIVTVWGRIEAHAAGIRAEHARVEAIADARPAAPVVAERLGVDLVPRDTLDVTARRYGAPLPIEMLPV